MHGGKIFSKSGCFLSSLVLVLYLLSGILHSSAIREDIRSGTCRDLFKDNFEEPGEPEEPVPNLSTRQGDGSCFICNALNDKKSWFYTNFFKTGSAKLIHVNITMEFTKCLNCKNQNIKAFVLKEKLQNISNANLVYQKLNSLTVLKNIKVVEPDKRRTHYFQYHPDSKSVSSGDSLVFLGEGVCAIIYEIKVWTFYCMESTIKAVPLPETASPAVGSLRVNSSCPSNTVPQGSEVFGLCSSDGEWNDTGLTPCLCRKRFTLGKSGCEGCEKNTYKPDIGNSPCTPCPLNAESAPEEVRCECKYGFYRLVGDNDDNPCYGIPSAVENIKYVSKTSSSVRIQWSEPSRSGTKNSGVFYEVECFKCKRADSCEDTCGPETMYWPAKTNLTQLNVTVEKLNPSTLYKFIIYSKNIYNDRINKSKWASSEKSVETEVRRAKSNQSKSTMVVVIAVSLGINCIISCCAFLLCIFMRKRRNSRRADGSTLNVELANMPPNNEDYESESSQEQSLFLENPATEVYSHGLFRDWDHAIESSWEFPKERLLNLKTLGSGNFGIVKRAYASPFHSRAGQQFIPVAVKILKETATEKDKQDFMSELSLMKKLEPHPYVVQFFGCCTESEPLMMILEYLPGGDLLGYLRKTRGHVDSYNTGKFVPKSSLSEKELLSFAWMVAEGMNFLSSHKIVHRDLAARNVLVNENNVCKLSDFGLAKEGVYDRKSQMVLWHLTMGDIYYW